MLPKNVQTTMRRKRKVIGGVGKTGKSSTDQGFAIEFVEMNFA